MYGQEGIPKNTLTSKNSVAKANPKFPKSLFVKKQTTGFNDNHYLSQLRWLRHALAT